MEKTDKAGYEIEYKNQVSELINCGDINEYAQQYEIQIKPFFQGGGTKGYVRGLSVSRIIEECKKTGRLHHEVTVLDCGSGLGELSVYLASLGFKVIGVEISSEGTNSSRLLAEKFNLNNCTFYATSLEDIPVPDQSVDFVIGHAALHHFIKYEAIPPEFKRVMKPGAMGFFADSFGENKLYSIFHDKAKMQRLGDVVLSKKLINNYFRAFEVKLVPTDWFVMLDKLYLKLLPKKLVRKISKLHFKLDRLFNPKFRINLYLAGAVMTEIQN